MTTRSKYSVLFPALILLQPSWAYAMQPQISGVFAVTAPLTLAYRTWGIAAIAIIFIEGWFFNYYWKLSWMKALRLALGLNLASTLISACISALLFLSSDTGLVLVLLATVLFFTASLKRQKAPIWFGLLAVVLFIVGCFSTVRGTAIVDESPSTLMPLWKLLLVIDVPLTTGLALALWIQALLISDKGAKPDFWKVVLRANLAVYLLLLCLFPYFAPNPYAFTRTMSEVVFLPENFEGKVEYFHLTRQTTAQLLGLVDPNIPPRGYDAWYEIALSQRVVAMNDESRAVPADLAPLLADTRAIASLTPEARAKLDWLNRYVGFYLTARGAIERSDQRDLNRVYTDWATWQSTTPYPGSVETPFPNADSAYNGPRKLGAFPHPGLWIHEAIKSAHLPLRVPDSSRDSK